MSTIDLDKIISDLTPSVIATRMTEYVGREYSLYRVSNWRNRGIPDLEIIPFCRAIEWKVTPHELRPDLYPHPDDGLPQEMRRCVERVA